MPERYIGGDFDSSASLEFERKASDSHLTSFPETLNGLVRNFYETATDSLAKIILEIHAVHHLPVSLWYPAHYCIETITRLKMKLNGLLTFIGHSFHDHNEIQKESLHTNILLFNHFNRYNSLAGNTTKDFKNQNWIVIEDFVHAPLDIAKTTGDYSFNSLRKMSDVEVSVCYLRERNTELPENPSGYYRTKKEGARLKAEFFESKDQKTEQRYLQLFRDAEASLNRTQVTPAFLPEVEKLKRIDWPEMVRRREENYKILSESLQQEKKLEILPGSYMYLIIKTKRRDELKQHMYGQGIFPVVHWPDSLDEIKQQLLSFHIDQRYNGTDMKRTADIVHQFYSAD
jgi:hypothetical protein